MAEDEVEWDYFISYTQANRNWAEWIAWAMEESGHRVLIQAWDFVPGSNWVRSMQEGIMRSRRMIAVLSNAYLESVFGKSEWQAAYSRDPQGFEGALIPVRVEPCDRPGLLYPIVGFDLFGMSDQEAKSVLLLNLEAVDTGRIKPRQQPKFPGSTGGRPSPGLHSELHAFPAPTGVGLFIANQLHALGKARPTMRSDMNDDELKVCQGRHILAGDELIIGTTGYIKNWEARLSREWLFTERRLSVLEVRERMIRKDLVLSPWSVHWVDVVRLEIRKIVTVPPRSYGQATLPATRNLGIVFDGHSSELPSSRYEGFFLSIKDHVAELGRSLS